MPRGLMDDLKGEVIDEEVHKSTLGYDILSADLDGEDALLLNIRQHRAFGVAHNISRLVCCERVGKVHWTRTKGKNRGDYIRSVNTT